MIRFRSFPLLSVSLSILVLVSVLGIAPAHAQQRGEEIQTADYDVQTLTYPELRDFEVPDPERMELDNGMTVFLLEDRELPKVNAVARIGTGSVFEPAEKRGLASITGSVMRTGGTASMSPDSVNKVLESVGATVETSIGETSGSAYMSALSENIDTVLPVFADVIRDPAFAEEKVQQQKSQRRSIISRRNDNAQQIAFRELDKLVYGEESPYARTPEYYTIDRIGRQDLVDFHGKYFEPSNVYLSVWGDFDADAMKERIRDQFADWPAAEDFDSPTPPEPTTNREYSVNVAQKSDVTQSTIMMGHPGTLTRDDPDYAPVTVMNEVLSGGFSGRLFQSVRKEQGLAYSVFGNYSAGYNRPGRFFAGVFTKSGTTVEATEAVLEEVKGMRENPPSEEELSLAKDSYLNSFVFNFDTKREILSRLMTYEYYDYPQDFLQQTKEEIEEVTADDVEEVATKYLYPDESHVMIVGNRDDFSESLSTLTKDGSVNEVDISIPREPPSEQQAEPTASDKAAMAEGQKLMASVKEALGGSAFDQVESMRVVTDQGGNESTLLVQLPNKLRTEMSTPMGSITVVDDGETMTMNTPKGKRTAPPSARQQIKGQLWRSLPYLLVNLDHEDLSVKATGEETTEGTTYETVEVQPPAGDAYTLYLDPQTMRPQRLTLTTMNPRAGEVSVKQVFSDYKEVSGLMIPHTTETTQSSQQGEQTSTATIQSLEVNPDLEANTFTMDTQSEE
jgi:predicted Zn-dependent peptidase/outer membrane lipoprotein-sorting protein